MNVGDQLHASADLSLEEKPLCRHEHPVQENISIPSCKYKNSFPETSTVTVAITMHTLTQTHLRQESIPRV